MCYTIYMHTSVGHYREARLSLDELVAAAGKLVRRRKVDLSDGRVAAAMDVRTIRYYQTLGLLDKPLGFDGRRAVYGFRHLLQLLCIKKLQSEGYPLALIQERLAGRPTSVLEAAIAEIGLASDTAPMAAPTPIRHQAMQRGLVAVEAASGVTIVIDPAQVADPHAILKRISAVLTQDREDQ